jgi:tetratricopeptide (TPR) repeat protein
MPVIPTIAQLTPTILPDDEKCLPWNLSAAQANPTSVKALKVPSKAKNEYAKACTASQKKNYQESEQHLRRAIENFNDYPAAWVMLGVVLDEQNKEHKHAMLVLMSPQSMRNTFRPIYAWRNFQPEIKNGIGFWTFRPPPSASIRRVTDTRITTWRWLIFI